MFRVILTPTFKGPAEELKDCTSNDIPELYQLQLEKIKISRFTEDNMSSRQIYLV